MNPHEYIVPKEAMMGRCRSCARPLVWGMTDNGKRVPLSLATLRLDEESSGQWVAQSHFRDCPDASVFSKMKGS